MTLSRRHGVYALAGLAALGAGLALKWRQQEASDPGEPALVDFWAREFDTPSGARLPTRSLRGRPLVLNFWATWCPPCVKEMPELDRFAREAGPRGWQVLGVAIDQADAVRRFLHTTPVSFPILYDRRNEVSKTYEVPAMPSTVIVDRQGRVRYVHFGYTAGTENEYQDQIRSLIRERS